MNMRYILLSLILLGCNLSDESSLTPDTSILTDTTIRDTQSDLSFDSSNPDLGIGTSDDILSDTMQDSGISEDVSPEASNGHCTKESSCLTKSEMCDRRPGSKTSGSCIPKHTPLSKAQCETCISDSECQKNLYCIPLNFKQKIDNYYCAPIKPGTGCNKPYVKAALKKSTNGKDAYFCTPDQETTTCRAMYNFGRTCRSNEQCGGGGYCYNTVCTYACANSGECMDKRSCEGVISGPPVPICVE